MGEKTAMLAKNSWAFLFMSVQETATVVRTDPHWPGNGGHSRPATPQTLRAAIKNAREFNSTSISLHKFNPKFITNNNFYQFLVSSDFFLSCPSNAYSSTAPQLLRVPLKRRVGLKKKIKKKNIYSSLFPPSLRPTRMEPPFV